MPASRKVDMSKNRILARLPARESKRLLPHLRPVSLRLKDVLYRPGDPIRYVYFPQDAVVSMIAPMNDGKSVEVNLIGNEGLLGVRALLGGKTYGYVSVIQVPGACLRISTEVLKAEFGRGGMLQGGILHYIRYLLLQTEMTAACNRVHKLVQRLARWLLLTRERVQTDEFPVTHEFLADMLGTPRSEVTRAAGALRRAEVIRYGRGTVTIADRKGLESIACECYQILYHELHNLH